MDLAEHVTLFRSTALDGNEQNANMIRRKAGIEHEITVLQNALQPDINPGLLERTNVTCR